MMALVLAVLYLAGYAQAYTRDEVLKRGFLKCGVSLDSPGFSSLDQQGIWSGFDVDFCRGVAAAVLGKAEKVEFKPLADSDAYTALLAGEVDLLSRHSSWTYTRDSAMVVDYAGISFFDGQGLLVSDELGAEKLKDLRKVALCSPVAYPDQENLIDYFLQAKVEYRLITFETFDLAVRGFSENKCNVLTGLQSQLYGLASEFEQPGMGRVLPEVITKEPLGPVVRQGDDTWFDIVRWTLFAMITAEELGVNSENVEEMRIRNSLDIKRLFGIEGSGGTGLGLEKDWAVAIVEQVGNYGEIFEKNLGVASSVPMERGLNRLWRDGGLQYAPPLR